MIYDLIDKTYICILLVLFIIDDIFNEIIVQFYYFNQNFCSIS